MEGRNVKRDRKPHLNLRSKEKCHAKPPRRKVKDAYTWRPLRLGVMHVFSGCPALSHVGRARLFGERPTLDCRATVKLLPDLHG